MTAVEPLFAQILEGWLRSTPRAYRVTVLGPDGEEVEVCNLCGGIGQFCDDKCWACKGTGGLAGELSTR